MPFFEYKGIPLCATGDVRDMSEEVNTSHMLLTPVCIAENTGKTYYPIGTVILDHSSTFPILLNYKIGVNISADIFKCDRIKNATSQS